MGLHMLSGKCIVDMSHDNYHSYINERVRIVQPFVRSSTDALLLPPGLVKNMKNSIYSSFQSY